MVMNMITWFLFLFSTLLVAWAFIYFGSSLSKDPNTPMAKAMALKARELPENSAQWEEAQKMYGQAEQKGGYGLAIVAVVGMLCVLNQEQQTIFIAGDLILALEILFYIGLRFWCLARMKKNPPKTAPADLWTHPLSDNPAQQASSDSALAAKEPETDADASSALSNALQKSILKEPDAIEPTTQDLAENTSLPPETKSDPESSPLKTEAAPSENEAHTSQDSVPAKNESGLQDPALNPAGPSSDPKQPQAQEFSEEDPFVTEPYESESVAEAIALAEEIRHHEDSIPNALASDSIEEETEHASVQVESSVRSIEAQTGHPDEIHTPGVRLVAAGEERKEQD